MPGPLSGVKIVELAGIGPGPMCAMLLADLGATVLRIDRKQPAELGLHRPLRYNTLLRSRGSIAVDLKQPASVAAALQLIDGADALIEGFRPGVTERLGLGPDVCLKRNPRLVYGRMTGWGQTGPLAQHAGHDINYLALTGVLAAIGRKDAPPTVPLNIVGDYAGGSLYLAVGLLAAIIEARQSGQGQVVDAAIVDGATHLATTFFGMVAGGIFNLERGSNPLDGGAHFYDCYECADGKWFAVGPIEKKFFAQLLALIEVDPASLGEQMDADHWADAKRVLAAKFRTRTRDAWARLLESTDACASPVLDFREAADHPHLKARGTHVEVDGIVQPAPAPRFSRTVPGVPTAPQPVTPENSDAALRAWLADSDIAAWRTAGIID